MLKGHSTRTQRALNAHSTRTQRVLNGSLTGTHEGVLNGYSTGTQVTLKGYLACCDGLPVGVERNSKNIVGMLRKHTLLLQPVPSALHPDGAHPRWAQSALKVLIE